MGEIRKENMSTLQDMLLDEEKLVTYVSLSKELCIHVNESKILLQQTLENIRQKKSSIALNVNYIISGTLDNCLARTVVCMEDELDTMRKKFKNVFFEHVYSVSKGSPRMDVASLLGTTKIEDMILCTGLIKGDNCVKRTSDEIGTLKSNSQDIVSVKEETTLNQPLEKIKKENGEKFTEKSEKKPVVDTSTQAKLGKVKIEDSSPKKDLSNKKVNCGTVRQKGITGFFNKSNGTSIKKTIVSEENKSKIKTFDKPIKPEDKEENKAIKVTIKAEPAAEINTDKGTKDVKTQKKTPNGDCVEKTKSQTFTKKNLKVDKKRKRVCTLPQSDSENEDNDPFVNDEQMDIQNDSEDEIPPTPTVNTIKITSGITNPRKKRKIVEKTYTGDDGYIITKKEEVYESCSDNDEEIKSKENFATNKVKSEINDEGVKSKEDVATNKVKPEISPKKNKSSTKKSKKKASPPQNGKQATMLNFFKRDKK